MAKQPKFLQSRLRLFLSADIIGSTALKQTPRNPLQVTNVEWFPILQGFYIEAQLAFLGAWERGLPENAKEKALHWGPKPEFWKVIGDEIVFTKELTDSHQLTKVLACWVSALDYVRKYIRERDPRLDVKCTAWTAGFPLVNKEVALPRALDHDREPVTDYFKEAGRLLDIRYKKGGDAKVAVDYIGPSIDIGFRLTQFATARKFILSVGVAYMLSSRNAESSEPRISKFRYDGSAVLKGVFGGTRYPVFWLDLAMPGDLALLEDQLTKPEDCTPSDVYRYCAKFFEEMEPYTFKPFIESDSETDFKAKPDYYDDAIGRLSENYAWEMIGDRESERAAEEEQPTEPPVVTDEPAIKPHGEADGETPLSVQNLNFEALFRLVRAADNASSAAEPGPKRSGRRSAVREDEEGKD